MDWESYDARLLAMRPEVLRDALRVYEQQLLNELANESGLNATAEMLYFGERLSVVQRWRDELATEEAQA